MIFFFFGNIQKCKIKKLEIVLRKTLSNQVCGGIYNHGNSVTKASKNMKYSLAPMGC